MFDRVLNTPLDTDQEFVFITYLLNVVIKPELRNYYLEWFRTPQVDSMAYPIIASCIVSLP